MSEKKTDVDLYSRLEALGIDYTTHEHEAVFTVEESQKLCGSLPGAHVKNLFLRDKKKRIWLATVQEDNAVDLKALKRRLGASGSLSFGSAELLMDTLGVIPGAVTPFGLLNDAERKVTMILDATLLAADVVNAHPLRNDRTTTVSADDLLAYIKAEGYEPLIIDFSKPLEDGA